MTFFLNNVFSGGSRPSGKEGEGGGGGGHPDSEIKGGPGLKKLFPALQASFWSKNKGGGRAPLGPPLDPPLVLIFVREN